MGSDDADEFWISGFLILTLRICLEETLVYWKHGRERSVDRNHSPVHQQFGSQNWDSIVSFGASLFSKVDAVRRRLYSCTVGASTSLLNKATNNLTTNIPSIHPTLRYAKPLSKSTVLTLRTSPHGAPFHDPQPHSIHSIPSIP